MLKVAIRLVTQLEAVVEVAVQVGTEARMELLLLRRHWSRRHKSSKLCLIFRSLMWIWACCIVDSV
jgi:hypothetical protein